MTDDFIDRLEELAGMIPEGCSVEKCGGYADEQERTYVDSPEGVVAWVPDDRPEVAEFLARAGDVLSEAAVRLGELEGREDRAESNPVSDDQFVPNLHFEMARDCLVDAKFEEARGWVADAYRLMGGTPRAVCVGLSALRAGLRRPEGEWTDRQVEAACEALKALDSDLTMEEAIAVGENLEEAGFQTYC